MQALERRVGAQKIPSANFSAPCTDLETHGFSFPETGYRASVLRLCRMLDVRIRWRTPHSLASPGKSRQMCKIQENNGRGGNEMATAVHHATDNAVTILAHFLVAENGQLPPTFPATSWISLSAGETKLECTTWLSLIRTTRSRQPRKKRLSPSPRRRPCFRFSKTMTSALSQLDFRVRHVGFVTLFRDLTSKPTRILSCDKTLEV
jgi:hypothetical protein